MMTGVRCKYGFPVVTVPCIVQALQQAWFSPRTQQERDEVGTSLQ